MLKKMKEALNDGGYGAATQKAYLGCLSRFLKFHEGKDPHTMGEAEVEAFVGRLEAAGAAASTRNQALDALGFFFKKVLGRDASPGATRRAEKEPRMPQVLSREEVRALLGALNGVAAVQSGLLYGCGLRISECLALRVRDFDLAAGTLDVRGAKTRRTLAIPARLKPVLEIQLDHARAVHESDVRRGAAPADNPGGAWVFPAEGELTPEREDEPAPRRPHVHEVSLARALVRAAKLAGITKRVTAHTLRHSYAVHLLLKGVPMRTLQSLLGHANLQTTQIYARVVQAIQGPVRSPLDEL